ncbi:MAG: NitT/TauT family transport system substrate-binding protein [Methylobacteriaceae bacterium]|nr:NitT/TauT family transport system substrate-binding protein [Methylobacteriaceae bacterium]
MKQFPLAAGIASALIAFAPQIAGAQTAIGVSYQPSLYWALPFYVATEKKWWEELGLKPNFSTFPAGAPQVAAAAAKSWDVGGTGSVPAVLGAARFGLVTIGITNDESKANALYVRAGKYAELSKDPAKMKGDKILITTNSTADYAAQGCLKKWGLSKSDVQFVNLGQAQIISAITSGNGDIAGVWAPNTYTLEEKDGAKYLCSGADTGSIIPGALIARADFVNENPEAVAKFLAVYLRSWAWIKAHHKEAVAMMKSFYALGGVEISDQAAETEFSTRPVFLLEQQLAIMDRAKGASEVDTWFTNIADFMKGNGTIPTVPAASSYIDDAPMKRVASDPRLKAFATKTD